MGRSGTVTIVFTDIVGSTDLLARAGDRVWDDLRRRHFTALREALADHAGTEVKNTGDGLMATFASAVDGAECALAMVGAAQQVMLEGAPISIRVGVAVGEATFDNGDWFGTPVVAAARLCALAGTNEVWATSLVALLAGSRPDVRFEALGPKTLKGFEDPIDVVRIEPSALRPASMFAEIGRHQEVGHRLAAQLAFWDRLPSIERLDADVRTRLALLPGDTVCDIGCGSGLELVRLAQVVGPTGRVIGVDPSPFMIDEARRLTDAEGVTVDLLALDGRATGLPDGCCDAVRIERVIQHVGDAAGFLREAVRITKPGGRIVVADTDWGSLMLHPGNRELIVRFKAVVEQGPIAEPWAGRTLTGALVDAGLQDVTTRLHPISAEAAIDEWIAAMLGRFVEGRRGSQAEVDALLDDLRRARERGTAVCAFTMFVASGRRP